MSIEQQPSEWVQEKVLCEEGGVSLLAKPTAGTITLTIESPIGLNTVTIARYRWERLVTTCTLAALAGIEQEGFDELRVANIDRQAEWDQDNKISLEYRGNELAGETGEACNIIKKLARERLGIRGSRATVHDLAEELADVVICVDLIAMHEKINLGRAVREKFNETSQKYGLATRLGPLPATPEPEDGQP